MQCKLWPTQPVAVQHWILIIFFVVNLGFVIQAEQDEELDEFPLDDDSSEFRPILAKEIIKQKRRKLLDLTSTSTTTTTTTTESFTKTPKENSINESVDDDDKEDTEPDHCEGRKDGSFDRLSSLFRINKPSSYLGVFGRRNKNNSWKPGLYKNKSKHNGKQKLHSTSSSNLRSKRPNIQRQIVEFPIAIPIEPIPVIAKALESLPPGYNHLSSISFPVFVPEKTLDHTYNYIKQRYVDPPMLMSLDESKFYDSLMDSTNGRYTGSSSAIGGSSNQIGSSAGWNPSSTLFGSSLTPSLANSNNYGSSFSNGLEANSYGTTSFGSSSLSGLNSYSSLSGITGFGLPSLPITSSSSSLGNSLSSLSGVSSGLSGLSPLSATYPIDSLYGNIGSSGTTSSNGLYGSGYLGGGLGSVNSNYPLYAYPVFTSSSGSPKGSLGSTVLHTPPPLLSRPPPPIPLNQILPHLIQHSTGYRHALTNDDIAAQWALLLSASNPTASHQAPFNRTQIKEENDSNEYVLQVRPLDPNEASNKLANNYKTPESSSKKPSAKPRFTYRTLVRLNAGHNEHLRNHYPLLQTLPPSLLVTSAPQHSSSSVLFQPLNNGGYSQLYPTISMDNLITSGSSPITQSKINHTENSDYYQKPIYHSHKKKDELLESGTKLGQQSWIPLSQNSTNWNSDSRSHKNNSNNDDDSLNTRTYSSNNALHIMT